MNVKDMSINQKLAATFAARAAEQQFKGKTRDKLALEFFIGAAAALNDGSAEQQQVLLACLLVSARGYAYVTELMNHAVQAQS